MQKKQIHTQEEAREHAIEWQHWAGTVDLSWHEVADWQSYFMELAERFYLEEEFKENRIC